MAGFREPMARKQGLKILIYGEDGSGKSVIASTFKDLAIVDTESKWGVYELHPQYGKNIKSIAESTAYYEVIELAKSVISAKGKYGTFLIDSLTNLYQSVQVSMMEVEEEKAKKYRKSVDDAIVGMRGWGKINHNMARLKNLIVQMSALGINVISVAHKRDVYDPEDQNKKIAERPDLKDTSRHDYDVVIRTYRETTRGQVQFVSEIEKDTSGTFRVGQIVENLSYGHFEEYMNRTKDHKVADASYDSAIDDTKVEASKEADESLMDKVYKLSKKKIGENKSLTKEILKRYHPSRNPKNIESEEDLKLLYAELKNIKPENEEQ